MKIIKLQYSQYKRLKNLVKVYDFIYGDHDQTIWSLQDLDELRKIGEEFMHILRKFL